MEFGRLWGQNECGNSHRGLVQYVVGLLYVFFFYLGATLIDIQRLLCTQESLLTELRVLVINSGSATCKANALPILLSFGPQ